MSDFTNPVFKINIELLHLAVELGAAQAAKTEVERQFSEQFSHQELNLSNVTVSTVSIGALNLTVPGYDIEEVRA